MSTDNLQQPERDAFATPAEPEPVTATVEHDEPFEGAAFRPDLREELDVKTGTTRSPDSECQGCGTTVSQDFARVFGDNAGAVHACPHCEDVNKQDIYRGAASGAQHDESDLL